MTVFYLGDHDPSGTSNHVIGAELRVIRFTSVNINQADLNVFWVPFSAIVHRASSAKDRGTSIAASHQLLVHRMALRLNRAVGVYA